MVARKRVVEKKVVVDKYRGGRGLWGFIVDIFRGIRFVFTIPFYIANWGYKTIRSEQRQEDEEKIHHIRESIKAQFKDFRVIKKISGDYDKWKKVALKSESKIGIIIGARGSGKTAFGLKFLENVYAQTSKKCYTIGFNNAELPAWINGIDSIKEITNDSFVLIDEGGILFNSRRSMSSANKLLSELILIARHKNLNILFISQNSSNLEINILRQADFLILKPSSLLQRDFERKIVQKIYDTTQEDFEEYKDKTGITYIYSTDFEGFVTNDLPSFWRTSISKSFRDKK
ncbi:MAG: zonular occludens toxin domain-containing protein [Candidatus Pacearchaeota archaeon]